ncbi:hypothetical protein [Bacillus seohaeanensis]|jgi:hypothetical protein|uniref:Uncharacterized protein n=1 Tax=Bacillus seohaeanensis TaxID=284580 RepID=A0ABW5RRD2_9BACI
MQSNNKGFILPYTLIFLGAVLLLTTAATQIFVAKYKYLANVKEIKEREISELDSRYLGMHRDIGKTGQFVNQFGTVLYKTGEEDGVMTMEFSFKRQSTIFPAVNFVYNKQTKEIKEWE